MLSTLPQPLYTPTPGFSARKSEMRPYLVSCIARPDTAGAPARPVTLTIWALGKSMAFILAQRQLDALKLTTLGSLNCQET